MNIRTDDMSKMLIKDYNLTLINLRLHFSALLLAKLASIDAKNLQINLILSTIINDFNKIKVCPGGLLARCWGREFTTSRNEK